jgi:hypothetical protein
MYRAAAGSADPSHNISPLDQKLLDACGTGDFEEAKSLLEQGASVDAVSAVCCHVFYAGSHRRRARRSTSQHTHAHAHTHTHTLGRR